MYYIAIIGDIKDSKKLENRYSIQEKLRSVLRYVNEAYFADISAKFVITLGDEFQGLLARGGHLLDIIKYIQREMYPVKLRFGVGIGEISTSIFLDAAIGADGPAYYAARETIEELREREKKLKKQAADIMMSVYDRGDAKRFGISEINLILALMKIVEDGWSDKQRYTIWDMMENGGSQADCAKRMGTTQSTVARRLADGSYITYEFAIKSVGEMLNEWGEIQNDNDVCVDS